MGRETIVHGVDASCNMQVHYILKSMQHISQ